MLNYIGERFIYSLYDVQVKHYYFHANWYSFYERLEMNIAITEI